MLFIAWRFFPSPVRVWIWVVTGGAISVGDLFVTGVFNLYEYKPGILAGRPDNYLGVLLAEMFFIPAYYTLLSAVVPRWRPVALCLAVGPVVALEVLFLWLGVYEHHGWQLWHTIVLFLGYSLMAAYGIRAFERRRHTSWLRAAFVVGGVYYAMNLWGLLLSGIPKLAVIRLDLVESPELDLVLSSLLLHAVPFTVLGFWGVGRRWLRSIRWAAAAAVGFAAWVFLLEYLGIYTAKWPWNPVLDGIAVSATHFGLAQIDRWLGRNYTGMGRLHNPK